GGRCSFDRASCVRSPRARFRGEMLAEPQRQRHQAQRRIGVARRREYRASGDVEIARSVHAAVRVDDAAAGVLVHPRAAYMMPLPADSLDPLVRVAVEVEAHAPEPGLAERKRDALLHRGDGPALELAEAKLYLGLT